MTTISQERLGKWFQDYRAVNVARGVKQGLRQGIKQGVERERRRNVDMMRRLAAIKFDAHTADRFAAILSDDPTAERMEQAGVAIMECNDGDELLARCLALVEAAGGEC